LAAAVKHESRHMEGDITFLYNPLAAPRVIRKIFGESLWLKLSLQLTEMLTLLLNEVYTIAITPPSDASKYLDYELRKFTRSWSLTEKRGAVKANWLLQAALLKVLCVSLEKTLPQEFAIILQSLREDMYDEAVFTQAERLFETPWNIIKAAAATNVPAKKQFNIGAESFQLSQLLTMQKSPLFKDVY